VAGISLRQRLGPGWQQIAGEYRNTLRAGELFRINLQLLSQFAIEAD
jgi:hypothetical protein